MKPSTRNTLSLILVSIFTFVACEKSSPKPIVHQKTTVKLPWSLSPEFAFLFCENEEPSHADSTIIEFETSKGSHEVAQAFALKKINFGFLGGDSLIVAKQKGIAIKALFALYQESPAVIVSLKNSGISSPKDLLGKRVGVIKASSTFPQFLGMMKNAGYPLIPEGEHKNITLDDAVNGGVLQLKTHQIEALTSFANFAPIQLLSDGEAIEEPIRFSEFGIDVYGTVFAASDEIIQSNPALVQSVTQVLLMKVREMFRNPTQTARLYIQNAEGVKGNPNLIDMTIMKTNELICPSTNPDDIGSMTEEGWKNTIKTLLATGQAHDFDVTECYNLKFLNAKTEVSVK
jgi:NitT/TauT family transport system substrate-binding protein